MIFNLDMNILQHIYQSLNNTMSKMALNYMMIVQRDPKPNGVVGSLTHGHEFFSLRDKKTSKEIVCLYCSKRRTLHGILLHVKYTMTLPTCFQQLTNYTKYHI